MHLDSEPKWPIQSFTTHALSAGEAGKQPDGSWGWRRGRDWSGAWRGGYSILVPGSLRSCSPRFAVGRAAELYLVEAGLELGRIK